MEYFVVLIIIVGVTIFVLRKMLASGEEPPVESMPRRAMMPDADVKEILNEIKQLRAAIEQSDARLDARLTKIESAAERILYSGHTPLLPSFEAQPKGAEDIASSSPGEEPRVIAEEPLEIPQPLEHRIEVPVENVIGNTEEVTGEVETRQSVNTIEEEGILASSEQIISNLDSTIKPREEVKSHPFAAPLISPEEEEKARDYGDLERFIGVNLINKIGIAILVLGISFFVKYAIDNDWINEAGRVGIGMLAGGILVGIAHFLRKNYRAFSSVLAGGGIATFYFTIAYGFHQYHLLDQTTTFGIMVIITAFAVTLSVLYDKIELAVIAALGGFLTPFLVATGQGNYVVLFTYLIILNAGLLALSYFKRWQLVNVLALVFTQVIFTGWLFREIDLKPLKFSPAVAFAFETVYFFMFIGMNLMYPLLKKDKFHVLDFSVFLATGASYFGLGMQLVAIWDNGTYRGLFTLAMGIVYAAIAFFIKKRSENEKSLFVMLIGLTLTFATLTIPIQLHGQAITMFWAAEFVLLFWLADYTGYSIFRYASLAVTILTLFSLFIDWSYVNTLEHHGPSLIFNDLKGFITNLVVIAAFGVNGFLMHRGKDEVILEFNTKLLSKAYTTVGILLLYIISLFSVNYLMRTSMAFTLLRSIYLVVTYVYFLVWLFWLRKREGERPIQTQFGVLLVSTLLMLISQGDVSDILMTNVYARTVSEHISTIPHWLAFLLFIAIYVLTLFKFRSVEEGRVYFRNNSLLVFILVPMVVLSFELNQIAVAQFADGKNYYSVLENYRKAGLTIVWALSSFVVMYLGMTKRLKKMRVVSLVVFAVVLLKLFIYDIQDISLAGKIIAFILLGVVLLVISFLYQKLKPLIFDEPDAANGEKSEE